MEPLSPSPSPVEPLSPSPSPVEPLPPFLPAALPPFLPAALPPFLPAAGKMPEGSVELPPDFCGDGPHISAQVLPSSESFTHFCVTQSMPHCVWWQTSQA